MKSVKFFLIWWWTVEKKDCIDVNDTWYMLFVCTVPKIRSIEMGVCRKWYFYARKKGFSTFLAFLPF